MKVTWDPAILSLVGSAEEGPLLQQNGPTLFLSVPPRNGSGEIPDLECTLMTNTSSSGSGVLATLKFSVIQEAVNSPVYLTQTKLLGPNTGTLENPINDPIAHETPSPAALVTLVLEGSIVADAGLPQIVNEDQPVFLDGSGSRPNSSDLNFTWTFFDNGQKVLTGEIVNYTFDLPGLYDITLSVADSRGTTANDTTQVKVIDVTPPVAEILIRTDGLQVGTVISLDGHGSYDPENGTLDPGAFIWSFGDDSEIERGQEVQHTYTKSGVFNVTLTVKDSRGNMTSADTVRLAISEKQVPNPNATPQQIERPLPLSVIVLIVVITAITIAGSALWLIGTNNRRVQSEDDKGAAKRRRARKKMIHESTNEDHESLP
jgi:hypothetical protein